MASEPPENLIEEIKNAHDKFASILNDVNKRSNRSLKVDELKALSNIKDVLMKSIHAISNPVESTNNLTNKLDKILELIDKPTNQNFPALPAHNSPPIYAQTPTIKPLETVIIHPKKDQPQPIVAETIHELIKKHIYSKKPKVKIVKINKNKSNVTIKCQNIEEAEKLTKQLSNDPTLNQQTNIFISKKQNPSIVIKNVDKFYDDSLVIQDIIQYNELSSSVEDYRVLFNINRNNSKEIVLRVAPNVFQKIKTNNFKIFLPGQLCVVSPKILTNQCQNCFMFGHKTKECRRENICYICSLPKTKNADGTITHDCSKTQKCVNCKHHNEKNPHHKKETNHFPNKEGCPYYDLNIRKIQENTNYGDQV